VRGRDAWISANIPAAKFIAISTGPLFTSLARLLNTPLYRSLHMFFTTPLPKFIDSPVKEHMVIAIRKST
jgi:hypothetical protein